MQTIRLRAQIMQSRLYQGRVFHKRLSPKKHQFHYKMTMFYLDIDELSTLQAQCRFFGIESLHPYSFWRKDFHGDAKKGLKSEIYNTVKKELNLQLTGPVRVLCNLRFLGINFNPLTTYYCYDDSGKHLQAIVAEVSNTPWLERHAYVIDARQENKTKASFNKVFTVSPFNPLNMFYHWQSSTPSTTLDINIDNYQASEKVFFAQLTLTQHSLTTRSLTKGLIQFPFIPVKIIASIYWQALILFLKGVPFLGKDKTLEPNIYGDKK